MPLNQKERNERFFEVDFTDPEEDLFYRKLQSVQYQNELAQKTLEE